MGKKMIGKNLFWILIATKAYHVPVLKKEVKELYLYMLRLVYLASVLSSLFSFKRAEIVQVLKAFTSTLFEHILYIESFTSTVV